MVTRSTGSCRNGLPVRTGFAILCTLNRSRHGDSGHSLDPTVRTLALRLTAPCFGGFAEPVLDESFTLPRAALLAEAREWRS